MSRPPVFPEQTASGIAVDPRTLERVVPETRRPDGSVRKQLKIRPGFTPQEDVSRFRGTRQKAMDATALPKGHILGWVAPSSEPQQKAKPGASAPPPNKNAKRRAKQRAKKASETTEAVKSNWDDEDEEGEGSADAGQQTTGQKEVTSGEEADGRNESGPARDDADLADKLSKLDVK
ncbi:hypothetical protein F5J12DRAFT_733824 [Pisolithus orientalis]|nr:uncharacterized protein F5J12DRAFT_733824 [Pisolithus orientalis]KAI6035305.1 hypothetical protein F5J12DRAFT_733824 [Pisolithus orientalis]